MFKLTEKIPMRGFLQQGSGYNKEVYRTEDTLLVERYNKGAAEPWMTRYVKRSFLGIEYWSFDAWWSKDIGPEKRTRSALWSDSN